jgi:hypothetical protein
MCRERWQQSFAGDRAARVESAVADGLDSFVLPRRHHQQAWWAAAAAIVFAIGALWFISPDLTTPDHSLNVVEVVEVVDDQSPAEADRSLISSLDFESGEIPATAAASEASPDEILFCADFETGSLDGLVFNRS